MTSEHSAILLASTSTVCMCETRNQWNFAFIWLNSLVSTWSECQWLKQVQGSRLQQQYLQKCALPNLRGTWQFCLFQINCSILQIKCAYYPCLKNLHRMRALLFVWEDVLWNINIIFLLTNTHTQLLPHGTTLNEGNRKQVFPKIELSDLANKQDTQFNLTQINDKYFLVYSMQLMWYTCTNWHLS